MTYRSQARKLSEELSKIFNRTVSISAKDMEKAHDLIAGSDSATKLVNSYLKRQLKQYNLKNSSQIQEAHHKRLFRIFYKKVRRNFDDVAQVPDVGRLRLLVNNADDIETVRSMFLGTNPKYNNDRIGVVLKKHPENNIEINEFEDFYYVPSKTGRVAIHLTLNVTTEGHTIVPYEVQIMLKDMVQTEEFTRDNYLKKQEIEGRALHENRLLTDPEKQAIQSYENSSSERYRADCYKHNLFNLQREDAKTMNYAMQETRELREAIPKLQAVA